MYRTFTCYVIASEITTRKISSDPAMKKAMHFLKVNIIPLLLLTGSLFSLVSYLLLSLSSTIFSNMFNYFEQGQSIFVSFIPTFDLLKFLPPQVHAFPIYLGHLIDLIIISNICYLIDGAVYLSKKRDEESCYLFNSNANYYYLKLDDNYDNNDKHVSLKDKCMLKTATHEGLQENEVDNNNAPEFDLYFSNFMMKWRDKGRKKHYYTSYQNQNLMSYQIPIYLAQLFLVSSLLSGRENDQFFNLFLKYASIIACIVEKNFSTGKKKMEDYIHVI